MTQKKSREARKQAAKRQQAHAANADQSAAEQSVADQEATEQSAVDDALEPLEDNLEQQIIALQAELQAAQARADESTDRVLRAQAEFENHKKRIKREMDNERKYSLEAISKRLLDVCDSLDQAVLSSSNTDYSLADLRLGNERIAELLSQILADFGVLEVSASGEKFDPQQHQAISTQVHEGEPNCVVSVLRKGYQLNDRLLRPAMVVVSKRDESQVDSEPEVESE